MKVRRFFPLSVAIVLMTAPPASASDHEGPWYFVPVHEAEIEAARTTATTATFHRVGTAEVPDGAAWATVRSLLERVGPCVAYDATVSTAVEGSFSLVPVADTSVGRVPLSTGRSSWADFDGSVQLTPHGFLAGVNVSSQGRGPAVLRAVATVAARVAGLAALARTAGTDAPVDRILDRLRRDPGELLNGSLACSRVPPRPVASPEEAVAIPASDYLDAPCPPSDDALASMPLASRWAVGTSPRACAALRALGQQAALVDTIRDGLHRLLADTPGSDDPNGLRYERRYLALSTSYREQEPKLADLATALGTAVGEALSVPEVAARQVEVERRRLPLDELCTVAAMQAADGRDRCARSWALLADVGVALAGEPAVAVAQTDPGPDAVAARLGRTRRSSRTFFFRQPIPARFRLLHCSATATEGRSRRCTAFSAEEPVTAWVLHPRTPLGSLTLEQKAFRSGSLAIEFSELGVPTTFRSGSTAAATGLAGAAADASAALRDEYRASLETLADIEEVRRELGLADLADEIERLENERERSEAAAGTGAASLDVAMAQARATAELGALRRRLGLGVAREVLDARTANRALAVRLAELEQAVEMLERQLAAGR